MSDPIWKLTLSESPLIATAIHDGHGLRDEVASLTALPDADRLREEDPFTGPWTRVAETRVVALRSRFEVDLNRPRERAFYRKPGDAWGLRLWRQEPGEALVERSLAEYDAFYAEMRRILEGAVARHGRFVVFDLHSYNHRRPGPDSGPENPQANPEVNVGTGTMNRERWAALVDGFVADLSGFDFEGRHLDVRENVRFFGGHLARWVHESFPETGCVLAIEFRKSFMDEWTGALDQRAHEGIYRALASTLPGVLNRMDDIAVS